MPLTAYYFMGQDLCMVRRHVREDMSWMADAGTDSVAIGIHEFQLDYGKQQQMDILFEEAGRAGLGVHAIPSRWAGLVAGWPPAAGMFAATHPDSWMMKADGSPLFSTAGGGPVCSIYDPATNEFFRDAIDRLLALYPVQGVIWDEIKVLQWEDHSSHAVRALGGPAGGDAHLERAVDFFGRASRHARERKPDLVISAFVYAFLPDATLRACAGIEALDFFGIDGKCYPGDGPTAKTLLGNFERVVAACGDKSVGTLALIETQKLPASRQAATVEHLPGFLTRPVDHLLYYYHGACAEDGEACMRAMKPLLRDWRSLRGR